MSKPKFDDDYYFDYEEIARSKKSRARKNRGIRKSKQARREYKDSLVKEQIAEL